ncbi:carbohydrate kinase family protein [bacterium]|nr:MAG: carbohydrate kinase family protein [bacterium]
MKRTFDFLCQGSVCTEILAWVDRYPNAGDAILADPVKWTGGGMAANTAAAIALLGGRVAFVSAVGDDLYGSKAIASLQNIGVNVDFMIQHQNQPTPLVILMINPSLQRAGLVLDMDEEFYLKNEDVPDNLIKTCKVFFTDMSAKNTSIELTRRAKGLGLTTAFDMQMSEAHINSPNHDKKICDIFELADFYFADEENFLNWTNAEDCTLGVSALLERYPDKTLVITKGSHGATITNVSEKIEVPAFDVPVVDTIGAGDAFHGAFLYAHIILCMSLRDSGMFASAVSAISCKKAGARDGLPTMNEVLDFLRERKISVGLSFGGLPD